MKTRRRQPARLAAAAAILLVCLAAAYLAVSPSPTSHPVKTGEPQEDRLDLTRPLPREQVLDLFRRLFALPAEDYLNWEDSVAAGKIPPDLQAFHEHILAFNKEAEINEEALSTEGLPYLELPEGPTVYPVLKATLGPMVGANVSQEDLNTLLPELAGMQQRVWQLEEQEAQATEALFTGVHLEPDDFAIVRLHGEAGADAIEMKIDEDGYSDTLYIDRSQALNGRHIQGARVSTEPFVSLRVQLTKEGSKEFARFTAENAGEMVAILIGGKVHSTIAIGGQIETRDLQLPGRLTEEEANAILQSWTKGEMVAP